MQIVASAGVLNGGSTITAVAFIVVIALRNINFIGNKEIVNEQNLTCKETTTLVSN